MYILLYVFCFVYRDSGALGSRLTGAGWGGCVVSLVPTPLVDSFIHKMKAGFYDETKERQALMEDALFSTEPGDGANIYFC